MINTQGVFEDVFKNTKENSIIIMDIEGNILDVNQGFLSAFGYKRAHIIGNNFSMLFTEHDKAANVPAEEVKVAIAKGSKSDNNYLVHKDGTALWVLGECVAVTNSLGEKYLVKIVQNINSQKKLERFLIESNEFLNTIFDSVKDAGFVILNSELRIVRCNKTFIKIFELKNSHVTDIKVFKLENAFWKGHHIRKQITDVIVSKKPMKKEIFKFINSKEKEKELEITSKLMENEGSERTILLIIRPK